MESVINLLTISFGSYISVAYFQTLLGKPKFDKSSIWKVYSVLLIAFSFAFSIDMYGVRLFVVSGVIFLLSLLYEALNDSRLFFSGLFVVVCSLVAAISVTILQYLSGFETPFITEYFCVLSVVIFCALIYGFVEFIKSRGIKANSTKPINRTVSFLSLVYIMLFSLAYVILLFVLQFSTAMNYNIWEEISQVGLIIFAVILAILLLFNILLLVVIDYQNAFDVEKDVNDEARRNLDLQRKHYKVLLDQHRLSHKAVHDLKNKIQVVILAVKLNKRDFALSKLEELAGETFSTKHFESTGNDVIDAILSSKAHKLNEKEIDLNLFVEVSNNINISDFDLAVIIGNSIDNAIEACVKLPASERYIEAEIIEENNSLSFLFTNPTSENLVVVENVVQTSKAKDKHLHGFGIENMHEIACKYDGHTAVKCENGFFELELNLNIPPV